MGQATRGGASKESSLKDGQNCTVLTHDLLVSLLAAWEDREFRPCILRTSETPWSKACLSVFLIRIN
jgi:hypothetical protein